MVARLITFLAGIPLLLSVVLTTAVATRRPTIDPVVIGRDAHEATGFNKDALNRSMKMSVPTMGPNSDFKQWNKNFLNFLSHKAAYRIPLMAIRESGV
jgi:hypothetical protein